MKKTRNELSKLKKLRKLIRTVIGITLKLSACAGILALISDLRKNRSDAKKAQGAPVHRPYGIYEKYVKRPIDAFLSAGALLVLSPVLLIVAILVRLKLGSPVLFTQDRPGKDARIFKLFKFRTMTDEKDENGNLLPDEDRLTSFGKLLRSTSLDELPELINILKGDMALVGPRPLLVKYLPRYTAEQSRRHEVRPGLTGLASSTIRNSGGWDKKLKLDVEYVDHISFLQDLKIIFWTARIVLRREGITEEGNATNSEFMGTLAENNEQEE